MDHYNTILTVIVRYKPLCRRWEVVMIQTFGNRERGVVYSTTNIFTKIGCIIFLCVYG